MPQQSRVLQRKIKWMAAAKSSCSEWRAGAPWGQELGMQWCQAALRSFWLTGESGYPPTLLWKVTASEPLSTLLQKWPVLDGFCPSHLSTALPVSMKKTPVRKETLLPALTPQPLAALPAHTHSPCLLPRETNLPLFWPFPSSRRPLFTDKFHWICFTQS